MASGKGEGEGEAGKDARSGLCPRLLASSRPVQTTPRTQFTTSACSNTRVLPPPLPHLEWCIDPWENLGRITPVYKGHLVIY